MNAPIYLKPWLANWNIGLRVVIFLILFSGFMQFVTFSLNQVYLLSLLGAQPEDVTFSIEISYVGILTAIPLVSRLLKYFEMKYFLVVAIIVSILLCIGCLFVTDIIGFFIIRFFQGMIVSTFSACTNTLIPRFVVKNEAKQAVGSSVFYGTLLSSGVFIGIVAANVELETNFKVIYLYLVLYLVFVLILVLTGFNNKSGIRPYPLYQIDWIGSIFFIVAASALAFTMIYGSKYYWFSNQWIRISALISVVAIGLYILREKTVKRPAVDLSVLKYPKFWVGLILLAFYFGMKESINLIYIYSATIVHWSPDQVTLLGLANVAGLAIFMIITAHLITRYKGNMLGYFIAGFCMMLVYHLWMYFIFTPDLSYEDLMFPMFFQGAASGMLFVPIMIFVLTSVPSSTGISGLIIAADARFIGILSSYAGFYNLQLYFNQLYKEGFLRHLTNLDEQTTEQINSFHQLYQSKGFSPDHAAALANLSLARSTDIQSQLLTNRAVFLVISIIIGIILVFIVFTRCISVYAEFEKKITINFKQMFEPKDKIKSTEL